jgi:hypothetical protein
MIATMATKAAASILDYTDDHEEDPACARTGAAASREQCRQADEAIEAIRPMTDDDVSTEDNLGNERTTIL